MAAFFELKHEAATMMASSRELAKKLGFTSAADTIDGIIQAFNNKEMMVVVAGEARRGKSTLLNALLGETTALFPVDVNVCTNVVTLVRYGETEKIQAYIEDRKAKDGYKIEEICREQIPDYVSEAGNPNNYKNVKLLNAQIPNGLLKEGIVFVDTPGVGSLNISHAETTYAFLPNADLLLFVSDTNAGFTETELNFLKRGYKYCQNIIYPVTKKDLNADYQRIVEDDRHKISQTLGIAPESIEIVPVSGAARLRSLAKNSASMYKSSNFQELEKVIWGNIARNRAEILVLPFVRGVREQLLGMADSVAAQYQLLNTDQDKTKDLIRALNDEIKKMETFQEGSAQWRNQITLFSTALSGRMNTAVQDISTSARNFLDNQIASLGKNICKEKVYSQAVCDINDVISQGTLDIKTQISEELEAESEKIRAELGLDIDMNKNALDKLNFVPDTTLDVVFPKKKTTDKLLAGGRRIGTNSMAGGAVGGILGGIAGFVLGGPAGLEIGRNLGALIGGALGSTKGCLDSLGKYDELDVNVVNKAMQQHISKSILALNTMVSNTIAELRLRLIGTFEQMLKKRIVDIKENISKMQKNINLVKSDVPARLRELKQENDRLRKQLALARTLEETIAGFISEEAPCKDLDEAPGNAEVKAEFVPDGDFDKTDGNDRENAVTYGFL